MKITVFGGAQPKPGEPAYEEALHLGQLLGMGGHTILTGGYMGTMEAVSRGAVECGGHVIGVTCEDIEAWRQARPNPYVQEEWRFTNLRQRLFALIDGCDAALALPGGAGTLAEVSLTWNQLIIGSLSPRPLILIGPAWKSTFEYFFVNLGGYVKESDRTWLSFVSDVPSAVHRLNLISQRIG